MQTQHLTSSKVRGKKKSNLEQKKTKKQVVLLHGTPEVHTEGVEGLIPFLKPQTFFSVNIN